ncbi:MAG: hypothetical protein KDD61_18395, partial [Bdellovibrionales bacterium]|nr:hypothetical protein [Bdellovibrionales bacterium]
MRTKKEFAQEIFKIIKDDTQASFSFFTELKDKNEIDIFIDLADIGVFDEEQLPKIEKTEKGYTQPFWAQAIYLEFLATYIRENNLSKDDPIVKKLLDVLSQLVENKENSTVVRSVFKSFSLLPARVITCDNVSKFFEYVSYDKRRNVILEYAVHEGFDSILETVANNNHDRSVFMCWLNEFFGRRAEKSGYGPREDLLFFDDYKLKEFDKKHFVLDEVCSSGRTFLIYDAVTVFSELLTCFLSSNDVDENSVYWRPAVEDHAQNRFHNSAQSVYVGALFKLINYLSKKEGAKNELVPSLMDSKYKSKNRIYIAVVSDNSDLYSIDECARKILEYGLSHHIKHEAYQFLEKHFSRLDKEIQNEVLDAIEALHEDDYAKDESEKSLFAAWRKIRWLQAIKDSGNDRALDLFESSYKITGNVAEHPDFSTYMSGGWVGPKSPWTKEEFAKAEPQVILEKLKTFENDDDFRGPTKEGLSRTFEDYIIEDPIKISSIVDSLNELEPIYISSVYDGFAKAWKDKKHVPIERLLKSYKKLLENETFCKEFTVKESKALWTVNSVLRFIKSGVRDDDNAFDPSVNPLCYEIIEILVEKVKPTGDYVSPADAYTRAINEPRGVLFETAILWALREARLAGENKDGIERAWKKLYVLIKEPLESKAIDEISLHALIGAYYRQFLYLNNSWVLDNLDLVAPNEQDCEALWVAFMEGFGYVSAFVTDMYKKLFEHGILLKFLRYEPEGDEKDSRLDRLQGRVVELSLIAYVLGVEELDNGIMGEVINDCEPMEWRKLVNSIVPITGSDKKPEHRDRIRLLMKKLFETYESTPNKESLNEHFSGVARLLSIADNIEDENVKAIVKIAAKNSEGFWDLSDIVEYLHKFKDTNPKAIGLLFVEALNATKGGVPTYPEDKIREIFEAVKASGE